MKPRSLWRSLCATDTDAVCFPKKCGGNHTEEHFDDGTDRVGKTEIARRLAKLMDAPFVKVEATKFTEVGYVGRDVDSMVRDLVEASIRITKQSQLDEKYAIADEIVEDRIIEAIIPGKKKAAKIRTRGNPFDFLLNSGGYQSQKQQYEQQQAQQAEVRARRKSRMSSLPENRCVSSSDEGLLEEQFIEIQVTEAPKTNTLDLNGEGMGIAIGNIFGDMMPQKKKNKKVRVRDARKILREEEAQNLIDMDQVIEDALHNAEQNGIIFIDEIDKIASGSSYRSGADVSREGVQRDILPIVEGSVSQHQARAGQDRSYSVYRGGSFPYGKTDGSDPGTAGKISDSRGAGKSGQGDVPENFDCSGKCPLKQHKALLETEGVEIEFTDSAIEEIATMAFLMNEQTENIGARRLHTILEKLLEDISFNIPDMEEDKFVIDQEYVKEKFMEKIHPEDIDSYPVRYFVRCSRILSKGTLEIL